MAGVQSSAAISFGWRDVAIAMASGSSTSIVAWDVCDVMIDAHAKHGGDVCGCVLVGRVALCSDIDAVEVMLLELRLR